MDDFGLLYFCLATICPVCPRLSPFGHLIALFALFDPIWPYLILFCTKNDKEPIIEDNPKKEDPKNKDDHKNEEYLKNEVILENKEEPRNWTQHMQIFTLTTTARRTLDQ